MPSPDPDPDMVGFPDDGDEFQEAADPNPPKPPAPASAPPPPQPDLVADLRARVERQERELEAMRRLVPPAQPRPSTPPSESQDEFDTIDWDRELFASPKEAIRKAITIATTSTEKRLRAEYQKDRGTQNFWDRFYNLHPDLKDDHDLVEVTLNSNLGNLANIPVEDAYTKLAELTRDRILRYAGGAARRRPKAQAEGGTGKPTPQPNPTPSEPQDKISSLSDFVRHRRQRRRAGAV